MKDWVMIHKIKALFDNGNGCSIKAIAKELSISRNTVRTYLRMDEEAIAQRLNNTDRQKILDSYLPYIEALLGKYPKFSAVKLLRRLKEKYPDIAVSDRSVRRYIQTVKDDCLLQQARYYQPVIDMVPGVQCQIDLGELRGVLINGVETTLHFVVFVLSYSRLMYVALSPKPINTTAFIQMHDAAFRYFNGCPAECVYDQTKLVVIDEQYRELTVNAQFHEYATRAGFDIRACEGYDPESKGKVEAGVKYVKNNALYGETFADWSTLEAYMAQWLETVANARVHGSTGEVPRTLYDAKERQQMKAYLTPAVMALTTSDKETRQADKTGLISWKANKYSVPMAYQRSRVDVRETEGQLIISDRANQEEIARHTLHEGKGHIIKNNHHYRDVSTQVHEYEQDLKQQLGEARASALCALLKATSPKIYKDQLAGIRKILKQYPLPDEKLLQRVCASPRLTASLFKDYLEAYSRQPGRLHAGEPIRQNTLNPELQRYASLRELSKENSHDIH